MKHAKVTLDGKELAPTYPNTVMGDDGLPLESDLYSIWEIRIGGNGGEEPFTGIFTVSHDSTIELRNEDFISPYGVNDSYTPNVKIRSSKIKDCGFFGGVILQSVTLKNCMMEGGSVVNQLESRSYEDCYFVTSTLINSAIKGSATIIASYLNNAHIQTTLERALDSDKESCPILIQHSRLESVNLYSPDGAELTVISSYLKECDLQAKHEFVCIDQHLQDVELGGNNFLLETPFDFLTILKFGELTQRNPHKRLYLYRSVAGFVIALTTGMGHGSFSMITTGADYWQDHLQAMLTKNKLGKYFDFARDSILSRIKVIQTIKRNKENHEQQKE